MLILAKACFLLIFCLILAVTSCTFSLREETGTLVVKISMPKAIPEVGPSHGVIILSKGSRIISRTFEFPSQSDISFQSIEKGVWSVSVTLKDDQDHVLYVGQTQVEVLPNVENTVNVPMLLNTAGLQINISVVSTEVARVKLELSYSNDIRIEERNFQNGIATFQFENLSSAVWNAKFTLYDQMGRQMLVWPEKGFFGIELQPGRLNKYSFTVNHFGNIKVIIEADFIKTVSSATLTNVEEGILISWEPVEGASLYQIYKGEEDHWIRIFEGTETFYLDRDVVENAEYNYVFNVVSFEGKHSGFSKMFTVVRDIPRIFVALQDGNVIRCGLNGSRVEQKVSNYVSRDIKAVRAVENDLFVVTNNSVVRLSTEDLKITSSQRHDLLLFSSNFDLNDRYLAQIASNVVRRVNLYNLADATSTQMSGTYISLDRHLLVLSGTTVRILNPETLQLIDTKNIDGAQRIFARGGLVFVSCYRNNNYLVEIHGCDQNGLNPIRSIIVQNDVRLVDASGDLFCLGIFGKGVYLGRTDSNQLSQVSSNLPVAMKIVGQNLYILYSNRLEVHSVNLSSLTTTLVAFCTFNQNCLALFAD